MNEEQRAQAPGSPEQEYAESRTPGPEHETRTRIPPSSEEEFTSLMAAWDDALVPGSTSPVPCQAEPTPVLRLRWQRDLACVRLLRQYLGHTESGFSGRVKAASQPPPLDQAYPAFENRQSREPGQLPWKRLGRFEIEKELGQGGFGLVLLAYDPRLGREVALKLPRAEVLTTPELRERFYHEARAAAGLDHPNIVPVFEAGEVGPICFIVSAYCPGITLAAWLKRRTGPVAFPLAAQLVVTLAAAVQHAHERGVVHRDLKPSNIILESAVRSSSLRATGEIFTPLDHEPGAADVGQPRITDFGLAKVLLDGQNTEQTQSGAIVGTPAYMAPEQAGGRSKSTGPAADIYALGAILYELLTSRPPFQSETVLDTLRQVEADEPLSPSRLRPKVPRDLTTICLKCLQKEPRRRYVSARALAEDLQHFLAGEAIQARPVGPAERLLKWTARRPVIACLCASIFVVTLLGFAGITWQWLRAEERRQAAVTAQAGADLARSAETVQRTRAEVALYFHRIALAYREWLAFNVQHADQLLEDCQPEHRGWEWHYLKSLCHADLLTVRGHNTAVASVAFSPDGKRIASGSGVWQGKEPGEVKIWDAFTGQELLVCKGSVNQVMSVAFSPDGLRLAAGSFDGSVHVWNAQTGEVSFPVRGHVSAVHCVSFSPDGKRLASGSSDQTVKLWDTVSGAEVLTIQGASDNVFGVSFSPDGRHLALGTWRGVVQYWDISHERQDKSIAPLLSLRGPGDVRSVSISPDGQLLAAAGYDSTVKVWELATATELCTFRAHASPVRSVAFAPDGTRVATAANEGSVKIWDARTGTELSTIRGHLGAVLSVAFSPDGRRLASGSKDRTIKIWDTTTEQEARSMATDQSGLYQIVFCGDGRYLASADVNTLRSAGAARLWEVDSGRPVRQFRGHAAPVLCVAFSPDGRTAATSSADGTVKIWDAASARELRTLRGHKGKVRRVVYSPNGAFVASAGDDRAIRVWDAATGAERFLMEGHAGAVTCLGFSPDSQSLVSGSEDRTVRLWDMATGQEKLPHQGELAGAVSSVVFSPDSRYLAAGGGDETIHLWNLAPQPEGYEINSVPRVLHGHTDFVTALAFSPNSQRLASSGFDSSVKVWDPASGDEILTLPTHMRHAHSVTFSQDGRRLAVCSVGVRIWEIEETAPAMRAVKAPNHERALDWHRQQASDYMEDGYWYGAVFHLDQVLAEGHLRPDLRPQRALAHAALGQWGKASEDYSPTFESNQGDLEIYFKNLALLLLAGQREKYRQLSQELLDHYGKTNDVREEYLVARICALAPSKREGESAAISSDPPRVLAIAERAVAGLPCAWHLHTLGLAQYRAGQYERATSTFWKAMFFGPGWEAHVVNWLGLSMAYSRMGRGNEARACFGEAVNWIEKRRHSLPRGDAPFLALHRHDWLACTLMRQEAEALLKTANP